MNEKYEKLGMFNYVEQKNIMKKEFKKSDLKTGMLVQNRDGIVFMVVNNHFVSDEGWDDVHEYTECLKVNKFPSLDIIAVSDVLTDRFLIPKNWTEETLYKNLLWKRQELKEYTMEELTSLVGHDFKIRK